MPERDGAVKLLVAVAVVLLVGCGGSGGETSAQQAAAPVSPAIVSGGLTALTLEYSDGSRLILEARFDAGAGPEPECFTGARLSRRDFPVADRPGDARVTLNLEPCEQ
jgi:hypothetical protein